MRPDTNNNIPKPKQFFVMGFTDPALNGSAHTAADNAGVLAISTPRWVAQPFSCTLREGADFDFDYFPHPSDQITHLSPKSGEELARGKVEGLGQRAEFGDGVGFCRHSILSPCCALRNLNCCVMPVTYVIDSKERLIRTTCVGDVTL